MTSNYTISNIFFATMSSTTIIFVVAAAIVGAALAFILMKVFNRHDMSADNREQAWQETKSQLAKLTEANEQAEHDKARLAKDKERAERLLKEATERLNLLDEQLKSATSGGKVDPNIVAQFADTEKLEKEIKKLKEQLEDTEDELDEQERKLKKKTAEFNDLQSEKSKLDAEHKRIIAELENVRAELKAKREELNMKMQTLSFVQSILSARNLTSDNIAKTEENIGLVESFVQGLFLNSLNYFYKEGLLKWNGKQGQEAQTLTKEFFSNRFVQWAATKRKFWLDGKTTIAFIGEFSAGKTSIVNRILSQDNQNVPLLPVSTKATTAIPTYISGAPSTTYSFISDDRRKRLEESVFKMVSKEVLDNVSGISSLIKYFVMTYNNPNLNGLSILDTPGFNSNDAEDSERTIEVINECDALFWVFDVNVGTVNKTSIELIKSKLQKPLYVVINKVDTKSNNEVDRVVKLIRDTFAREGIQVQGFIRFSQKAPLATIMEPIKHVSRDTTRDSFLGDIDSELDNIHSIMTDHVKAANQEYQSHTKQWNQIISELNRSIRTICQNCETARGIPHWEEHFFSSDRYEMSAGEGSQLISLLDNIAGNNMDNLVQLINSATNCSSAMQQAYTHYRDMMDAHALVEKCQEEFNRIKKHFK